MATLNILFGPVGELLHKVNMDPQAIYSKDISSRLITAFDLYLLHAKQSERMFTSIQPNHNSLTTEWFGMGYQLVSDDRFRPYIDNIL